VGVAAAFGFAGNGAGGALAVASDFLAGVNSSVEAVGSTFAGAEAGEALAVASGFLAGVNSSVEAAHSAVAGFSVALGVAVDPGGQVIQHSAPAGNDRNANPVAGTSTVSRRDFAFIIHPPFIFGVYSRPFSERVREAKTPRLPPLSNGISPFLAGWRLATDKFTAVGSGDRLALLESPRQPSRRI
jgi:hypothetical protein